MMHYRHTMYAETKLTLNSSALVALAVVLYNKVTGLEKTYESSSLPLRQVALKILLALGKS